MGATAAMVFSPVLGWQFAAIWAVAYVAAMVADVAVFAPISSGRTDTLGPAGNFIGCLILIINGFAFGSISIPLWLMGGVTGGVCATLLLAASAVYNIINGPESRRVLVCTVTAQFCYLLLTPVFLINAGAPPATTTAATISVIVYIAFCVNTWSQLNSARIAERAARRDADRRRIEAERSMADRSAFLAAVGHDLRTPIGAIMTGASELERAAPDSISRSHAALIGEASVMMKVMLDDLLDHAKLEAGRMTVDEQAFNLRSCLAQTLRFWQGPARERGLRLRLEGAAETPAWVRGDPVRLRQVLNNLISNALKFTGEGAVCLRVRAWEDDLSGYGLLIDIRDTGRGMNADQMTRLFSPFDQTQDGVSAQYGGTGLGLSISRDLARLMGGRLTARSVAGEGSVFTLALTLPRADTIEISAALEPESRSQISRSLARTQRSAAPAPMRTVETVTATAIEPVEQPRHEAIEPPHQRATPPVHEPAPAAAPEPEVAQTEEEAGRALRVLVVDDHEINRRAIQMILAPLGAEVAMAEDGLVALSQAAASAYDVIFMDVRMPELDGRETTRRLRASPGPNQTTPIVAVTADTAKEDVEACLKAGMNYFVSKPLTPAALLGALSQVLEPDAETAPQAAVA
jgi:signal transduction histidine kinase/ActR/RegA family two-component response regulator